MRLYGLRKDRTHHESAEGAAEPCFLCCQHHTQAQTQGEDDQRLVIQMFLHLAYQCRDNQYAAYEPSHKRNDQIDYLACQLGSLELMADGNTREQYHQYHSHHVLNDQDAGSSLHETLLTQPRLVDSLHHDSGARHTKHTCQEQGVYHVEFSVPTHEIAEEHHARDNCQCADCCHLTAADKVLQAELQTDAEQHEQHTDVAPLLHVVGIHEALAKQIRTYQDTCYDIAQHHRLFQELKQNTDYSCCNHQNV